MLKIIKEQEFEKEVLQNQKLCIVDFFATWCGPCQMLGPILEKLAEERKDVDIIKINIDECSELTNKYGIDAVPTMIIIKNGQEENRIMGLVDREEIVKEIEKIK